MPTIQVFAHIENKHTLFKRVQNYTTIQEIVTFVEKESNKNSLKLKINVNLEANASLQVNMDAQHTVFVNQIFNMSHEISVVFHNGSSYHYHFIINELANEFEGKFKCFGENTEKLKTFFRSFRKISFKH